MSIAELRAKLGKTGAETSAKRETQDAPPPRPRVIWPKRWSIPGAGQLVGATA